MQMSKTNKQQKQLILQSFLTYFLKVSTVRILKWMAILKLKWVIYCKQLRLIINKWTLKPSPHCNQLDLGVAVHFRLHNQINTNAQATWGGNKNLTSKTLAVLLLSAVLFISVPV